MGLRGNLRPIFRGVRSGLGGGALVPGGPAFCVRFACVCGARRRATAQLAQADEAAELAHQARQAHQPMMAGNIFFSPSLMTSTLIEASTRPMRRVITLMPVRPMMRAMCGAAE